MILKKYLSDYYNMFNKQSFIAFVKLSKSFMSL